MNLPIPPYYWDLHIHPDANQSLDDLLTALQRQSFLRAAQELALQPNPLAITTLTVRPVPGADKLFVLHGPSELSPIKLRVLFALVQDGNVLIGDKNQLVASEDTVETHDTRIVIFWAGESPIPELAVIIAGVLLNWY